MKIMEMIERVQKDESNESGINWDELYHVLNKNLSLNWNATFQNQTRLKGYYLQKWYCTDSWVGRIAYYLDNEPVAFSVQMGRKCDVHFSFVSHEAAIKIKEYIATMEEDKEHFSLIDPEEEFSEFYNVEYPQQLLTDVGFINGQFCKVIKKPAYNDYMNNSITVEFSDNTVKEVQANELCIPYHINPFK